MIRSLFSINPADELSADDVLRRQAHAEATAKRIVSDFRSAARSRREHEIASAVYERIYNETRGDMPRHVCDRVAITRKAMAQSMHNLAVTLSTAMMDALGSWYPAPDQAGTGLEESELREICRAAGIDDEEGIQQ